MKSVSTHGQAWVLCCTHQLLAAESQVLLSLSTTLFASWGLESTHQNLSLRCLQCPQERSQGRPGAARQAQPSGERSTAWLWGVHVA